MKNIREKLYELSDNKYKEFHSSLCPNSDNILGVRVPELRKLAKEIVKNDLYVFYQNIEDKYYEEIMLQGMCIGYANISLEERIELLKKFIPKIDNWAICDCCCSTYKFTNKNKKEMWNFINTYLSSKKEFELRFAIVMMMDYYIEDEYIDIVLQKVDNIKSEEYYVQMAKAWLIQVAFIKYEEKTLKYLKNNKLDKFTYNKALQKIIESYRVDEKTKNIIKNMKIN